MYKLDMMRCTKKKGDLVQFLDERCSIVGYKQIILYVRVVLKITILTTKE